MENKKKVSSNNPHSKRITVKNKEDTSDSKSIKKVFKRERNKKDVEEITESENSDNDDKTKMGDLSSNLDGYSRSKGVSTCKDNVEGSKDRITKSNVRSEALGEDEEKQSIHPSHPKRNDNEEKMEEDADKGNEGKDLAAKDNSLSKEEKEERMEKQDINTDIQINTITTNIDSEIRVVVDGREESNEAKLSFLHTAKLKAEASLQGNYWLYNEIMVLKKTNGGYAERTRL